MLLQFFDKWSFAERFFFLLEAVMVATGLRPQCYDVPLCDLLPLFLKHVTEWVWYTAQ